MLLTKESGKPLVAHYSKSKLDMALNLVIIFASLSLGTLVCCDFPPSQTCTPLQYVEYGKQGLLECDYRNYFSVIWYNSSDHINDDPIFYYTQSVKSGPGYRSGEFDVEENGSLVIKNVSLQHEHNFTVIKLDTADDISKPSYIQVVVIVKPSQQFPVIHECGTASEFCFKEVYETLNLSCYVRDVRPAPNLIWLKRYASRDLATFNELSALLGKITYTSRATITVVRGYVPSLELLVCRSFGPIPILQNNQSYILLQTVPLELTSVEPVKLLRLLHSKVQLICSQGNISNIVWKLQRLNHKHLENILAGALGESRYSQILLEGYELDNEGSLIINDFNFENEGLYGCIWRTGSLGGINTFNVTAYVPAVPKDPFVNECEDNTQYCVVQVGGEGSLTCTLKRIRPLVYLEWIVVSGNSTAVITFFDDNIHVTSHQDTFEVVLTSKFTIKATSHVRLTVQCKTRETEWENLTLFTQIELFFIYESADIFHPPAWALITIVAIAVLSATLGVVFILRRASKRRENQRTSPENVTESIPMLSAPSNIKEKRAIFQQQLRGKYEDLYAAIQPIPYVRDKYYSVEKLFVEPEMLWQQQNDTWKPLKSLHDIIRVTSDSQTRILLEGDPGYGKTTITLQIAYDWCNRKPDLKDIEILLLIRLRQLSGVNSIYKAIKYFLLPKDSALTETDIENILRCTGSAIIILDGFDEYPNQEDNSNSHINDIIERNMFQNFKVITTTRSYCLPKHYVANTCRIKLTGFDDFAREKYINKTAIYISKKYKDEIKRRLYANPVIKDICQVPLFFVMFTHMVYKDETSVGVKSITGFFKCVIACIYSHMKKKLSDKNVNNVEVFDDNHTELDRVAFNSLCENAMQSSWSKEHLDQLIGAHLCDHYIHTGILVKEEIVTLAESSAPTVACPITYKTEVRFFHLLFCEWYAAHHVAWQIEHADEEDVHNCLKKINPFQLHYVYRFACGLNKIAAQKIIENLNKRDDGRKLACLCLLEQTENFDKLVQSIGIMCSKEIEFGPTDSRLFHRSTVQLLEIASSRKISISCLKLTECINYVHSEDGDIVLYSDVRLPALSTAQKIIIIERRKSFSHKELECLLDYACRCVELKTLGFYWCMLPEILHKKGHLSKLTARGSKVIWKPIESSRMSFCFNVQHVKWEDESDGGKMTKMEYKQILSTFQSTRD
ncbi:NLR family CARD domain-containing protein 4 [Holothuria leucospilota]|uniref:NLR family CARD domain-containing protein 4 n=1 Tax=Holothuria leucospilota TaxID=206669 RepID=A0A9Q1HI34_HOLLE|nr:NLR family CARD domain-containing protein 4 [Holothuria leucospilota]